MNNQQKNEQQTPLTEIQIDGCIHRAAARTGNIYETEYATDGVLCEPHEQGVRLVATNGVMVVVKNTTGRTDRPRIIPREVLSGEDGNSAEDVTFNDGMWESSHGRCVKSHEGSLFPPYRMTIPDDTSEYKVSLGIDAAFLKTLAAAMAEYEHEQQNQVYLAIKVNDDGGVTTPILVTAVGAKLSIGVIMPCKPLPAAQLWAACRDEVMADPKSEPQTGGKSS